MKKEKIYLSGKISGLPREEATKCFAEAEKMLRTAGYKPVNPIKTLPFWLVKLLGYKITVLYDLWCLWHCDYIYLLKNWADSRGAQLERYLAAIFDIPLLPETAHED